MPIRLSPSNLTAAATAETELPGVARALASLAAEAAEPLADLPAAANVQACLDAWISYRRMGARLKRTEDRMLLLMHRAGASPYALATALGINAATVTRRIEAAEAETA